ncbi:MAG: DUF5106 domain-containing protein [Flavobacteriales bacterium]
MFERAKGYKAGVYAVVVPGPKYFELVVNEPLIVLETDTADLGAHLVVKKSAENQLFLDYVRFVTDKRKTAEEISKSGGEDPISKAATKKKLQDLEREIKDYQVALVAKAPNTLTGMIVKMSTAVDEVEVKKPDGSIDSLASYYAYRQHFWDNTDLTDERILRTPVFQNKFDEYIGKVIPQVPDTINRWADDIIRRMDQGDELFKFAVHTITYKYETSDIMGMDAVFVHMAQTYYCPGPNGKGRATWMPADKLKQMCERAEKWAPLIIGSKGKDIILPDTTEERWLDYYRLPQEYVLLVFWDPHCGHCKKALPELYEEYKTKLKPLNVEVFAVANASDSVLFNDWKAFIREHDLRWVNVGTTWHMYQDAKKASYKYVPRYTTIESLNYASTWDIYSTPRFFLMDGDRKIVGKQLAVDQMVELIGALNKRKATKEPPKQP